jgi:hypothetical protein
MDSHLHGDDDFHRLTPELYFGAVPLCGSWTPTRLISVMPPGGVQLVGELNEQLLASFMIAAVLFSRQSRNGLNGIPSEPIQGFMREVFATNEKRASVSGCPRKVRVPRYSNLGYSCERHKSPEDLVPLVGE